MCYILLSNTQRSISPTRGEHEPSVSLCEVQYTPGGYLTPAAIRMGGWGRFDRGFSPLFMWRDEFVRAYAWVCACVCTYASYRARRPPDLPLFYTSQLLPLSLNLLPLTPR